MRDGRFFALENPAFTGMGRVRAMARAYSALATGWRELGLFPETLAALTAAPVLPSDDCCDKVLHTEIRFSLGFLRPFAGYPFGSSDRAFGVPGAGGSFAFADPDAQTDFAYAPNRLGLGLPGDPREALCQCLERDRS